MAWLLARAQKLAPPGKPPAVLFSSDGKKLIATSTPGKRVAEICKALELEPFDVLDLRRTVETLMTPLGIDETHRAYLQSHDLGGVQRGRYNRWTYYEEKRAALEAWEAALAAWEEQHARKIETLAPKRKSPQPAKPIKPKSRAKPTKVATPTAP